MVGRNGKRQSKSPNGRRRVALGLVAALVVGLSTLVNPALTGAAEAGPVDAGWAASGPGTVTTDSDGSAAAAAMSYNLAPAGFSTNEWTFQTTATEASAEGSIKVPWTWQGFHAWFGVTARLEMVVNGEAAATLVDAGPTNCCSSPSGGFVYGGVATFDVEPGQTYGFRLSGSNGDSDNSLRGSLTLSTKPYLDATIGSDNRQWLGAADLPNSPETASGVLAEPGEARWYRFPVVPGQRVSVTMDSLPADYDMALYGDIEAAYERLQSEQDLTKLAAGSSASGTGSGSQVPEYPDQVTSVPTKDDHPSDTSGTAFAPRIYAPRIYAPRIYAPRIYAPRIYAPRIYAPRIYAPEAYDPSVAADAAFRDAFSSAQNESLLAVSAKSGFAEETVSATTGNNTGYFYVRVQGHTDGAADPDDSYRLTRTTEGGEACEGLEDFASEPTLAPTRQDATTVIVTDSARIGLADAGDPTYMDSLGDLADATDGAVVDVRGSARIRALQTQADEHVGCPYATNLVASAIKDVVDSYRNDQSRYVVLAGGDEVVPFFRYPDLSGLGQESQFSPPVLDDSASGTSLSEDQVQSQDAYGSDTEVTIAGVTMPLPDLAVGRLVKTAEDITATVEHYLDLDGGSLPVPESSLVTGYDFLADAAHGVDDEFTAALGPDHADGASRLISEAGTPHADSWTGDDLREAIFGARHDLMFLAGHFSANDTLAADFDTTVEAGEFSPDVAPGVLTDTVVLSAGCHSGYNIVNGAAVPGVTNTYDWTQAMAQQNAVLIGGTGYQYGDTDFLEYSERLYLGVARQLRAGEAGTPVAIGEALARAKQDYLASLVTVTGIDEKSVLQATMYGLPMTGVDVPGRAPTAPDATRANPSPVSGGPGEVLGLQLDDLSLATPTVAGQKDSNAGPGLPDTLRWRNGADGVTVQPGAPALPKQIEDVSVAGTVLRGVGFRSGTYADTTGVLPLTGAPSIEASTSHSTFTSEAFFPQRLATPNYFDSLGRGGAGRTSLVLTPAQYRTDPQGTSDADGVLTNTVRAYSDLGVRLFYSSDTASYAGNQPSRAMAPSMSGVTGTVSNGVATFSTYVHGDPSAGVQQVWVTWTGSGNDSGHGRWQSIDLQQDPADSAHWTGTLTLPAGQSVPGLRFLVQAVNGVGVVGLDTAEGDGYGVRAEGVDAATVSLTRGEPTTDSPLGVAARVVLDEEPVADRLVQFTVFRAGEETTPLFEFATTTGANGHATLRLPPEVERPTGSLVVVADLIGLTSGEVVDTDRLSLEAAGTTLEVSLGPLVSRTGAPFPTDPPLVATVRDALGPVAGQEVVFALPTSGPRATFPGGLSTFTGVSDADGTARAPTPLTAGSSAGSFDLTVSTEGAEQQIVPMAAQLTFSRFARPISNTGTTRTRLRWRVPVVFTLLSQGRLIDRSTAASLARNRRVEVAWEATTTDASGSRVDLVRYARGVRLFHAGLKPSSLGWERGQTYRVTVRVLPTTHRDVLDLGSRSFLIKVI